MKSTKLILTLMLLSLILVNIAAAQNVVAIMNFKNNGQDEYDYLQSGAADILTTTLATSQQIQLVERSQLQQIMEEMSLGMTRVVDASTAAQVGKVTGAQYVVLGSFMNLGKSIRLDAKVVETETALIIPGATASSKAASVETIDVAIEELAQSLLNNLTGEEVKAEIKGNPNQKGRLEFTFTEGGFYAVLIDGENLEATNGMKGIVELGHGKHLIQIERIKGLFKSETEFEDQFMVPGGYILRAHYKDKKFEIYETIPIPGMEMPPQQKTPQSVTSTTTTTTKVVPIQHDVKVDVDMMGMKGKFEFSENVTSTHEISTHSEKTPNIIEKIQPTGPATLIFMSKEGMCDIYLDGEKEASINIPDIDAFGKASIYDVDAGTYLLKIEGFDVWYEGKLDVSPGEEIKIQVEPDKFDIVSRNVKGVMASSATSKLIFMSNKGMCDIYLDGEEKASIDVPGIGKAGKAQIFDVKPDIYTLKIQGFEVWYEDKLEVFPGEEIKIQVEPDKFEIISRKSIN